jgi:hypothetical protein
MPRTDRQHRDGTTTSDSVKKAQVCRRHRYVEIQQKIESSSRGATGFLFFSGFKQENGLPIRMRSTLNSPAHEQFCRRHSTCYRCLQDMQDTPKTGVIRLADAPLRPLPLPLRIATAELAAVVLGKKGPTAASCAKRCRRPSLDYAERVDHNGSERAKARRIRACSGDF